MVRELETRGPSGRAQRVALGQDTASGCPSGLVWGFLRFLAGGCEGRF